MFASSRKLVWVISLMVALLVTGCATEPDSTLNSLGEPSSTNTIKAAPAGYYNTADESTSAALRASLHEIIDDHTRIPYTSSSTDTWNVLEEADQDPNNSGRILDVYLNASYQKWGAGNTDYNREHTWPKSYGFPNDGSTNYPYTDCHHLFLSNDSRNSSRGNKPYGTAGAGGTEYTTEVNNGVGGGSGTYPGWSNWADTTYWETWWDRRGDVARALFYLDVRYEGGTHGVTGVSEPDLILTDNLTLIENSNTGSNNSTAYMGLLAVLLQWHLDDPVDAKEMAHTDAVYTHQGNRNPFVDHPEWVDCIFNASCGGGGGDTTPPAAPTGLGATAGDGSINLDWNDNGEADLAGYDVFRGTAAGGPYNAVNGTLLGVSQFTDTGLTNGTTYYYVVTASDVSANESGSSAEANATPAGGGGGGTAVWINEFHYDNDGGDTGEFFEIAGTAGTNLSGWSVVAYNGNGGSAYSTVNLSGSLPNQQDGLGTLSFNLSGMQNGAPDGLALIDDTGTVVEFLSYEGSFTATDGAAAGTASTDVGVSEISTTPVGHSLQLAGTGSTSGDFTWQAPQANTAGTINTGQTFSGGAPTNQAPTAVANGPYSGDPGVSVSFSSAGSFDPDGTITTWAWTFGDGGTSILANPGYTYATAGTYTVTLTVTDDDGAENTDTTSANIADTTAPAAPSGLGATAGDGSVALSWSANGESDLDGYTVYRGTVSGGPYTALNGTPQAATTYTDATVSNGTTYYYVVTASDLTGNESGNSTEAGATPAGSAVGGAAWINEFHYDNDGGDVGEFVEIAGAEGTDLAGWSLVAYNGNGGTTYGTLNLSGILGFQQGGFGTLSFNFTGLQNGAPDGLALIDDTGAVVEFLSYEGSFTASDGAAVGIVATDVGVAEASTTPVGYSLQLAGTGSTAADFTWQAAQANTAGDVNTGQTLGDGSGPPNLTPTAAANGPYNGEAGVSVSFSSSGSSDPDGTITDWAWTFGDGGTSTQANPSYTYAATGTYTVTLTVTDDQAAEDTDTTSATIVDTTAPAVPSGLGATAGDAVVDLSWSANSEGDLDGYTVYRSTSSGGPYSALNGAPQVATTYNDATVNNGTTYYYVVTASDQTGNESGNSSQVSALPEAPPAANDEVWINEFHYDNSGGDKNERVEVAGTAGVSLSGWTIVAYNGNGGGSYKTYNLSGTLSDQQGGFGTKYINTRGLQNGAPDGIALVDDTGTVVQFLSYEGSFTASDGPAAGLTSTDVGVSESSSSNKNHSLQLGGTGNTYADFTWQPSQTKTSGSVNTNQTFSGN